MFLVLFLFNMSDSWLSDMFFKICNMQYPFFTYCFCVRWIIKHKCVNKTQNNVELFIEW